MPLKFQKSTWMTPARQLDSISNSPAIQYWEKMEHNRWSNSVWAFSIFVIVLVLAMIGVSIFFYQFFQQPVTKLGPAEIAQAITRVVLFGTIVAFVIWGLRQAMRLWAIQQQLLIDTLRSGWAS